MLFLTLLVLTLFGSCIRIITIFILNAGHRLACKWTIRLIYDHCFFDLVTSLSIASKYGYIRKQIPLIFYARLQGGQPRYFVFEASSNTSTATFHASLPSDFTIVPSSTRDLFSIVNQTDNLIDSLPFMAHVPKQSWHEQAEILRSIFARTLNITCGGAVSPSHANP